jgi:hypothetical protein
MVFKKLADRLVSAGTNAVSNALRGGEQQHANEMRQLESMGFPPERARHALNATDGDVDRAAELLLLGGADEDARQQQQQPRRRTHRREGDAPPPSDARGGGGTTHVAAHNDEQLRRAMEESLRSEETRRMREAEAASLRGVVDPTGGGTKGPPGAAAARKKEGDAPPGARKNPASATAAAANARNAATARRDDPGRFAPAAPPTTTTTRALERTHPAVQLPERLSNKSREEQILRCADRLKSHAMAVDTLHRALSSVRGSPGEPKFRVIDRSNANYARFVRDKPGAEDMLLAVNYRIDRARDELRLERHLVDDALLYLGIEALEKVRTSDEYVRGKKSRAFHAEMGRVACAARRDVGMTEAETSVRLAFMSKCPREPPEGRGALIQVCLGDESEGIEGGRVSRRFDGDDTLEDVLNWLGGCYGNEVLEKMRGASRVWCLCDMNNYPVLPFDVERHGGKTLQYLGLFPSGKLGVRLSNDAWRDREEGGGFDISGSVRGLGAASRSMLH